MPGLSKKQKNKLKEHGKHHSKGHIKSMLINMMRGMSFKESHNIAMKKEGK
jgi:hypothetical protein